MPRAKKTTTSKPKKSERRKTDVSRKPNRRKNIEGNWRGMEDRFFTKVRNGFRAILKPVSK